ncbi:MAG: hypothetical protein DHS20C11_01590 [Lysobacteraceae bacterium]|nr:MAG: hypothetical protein DHS20C11_01590 [Xanthomonadaceae bacterium]
MKRIFALTLTVAFAAAVWDVRYGQQDDPLDRSLRPDQPYERQQLHEQKRLPPGADYLPPDPYRQARSSLAQMPLYSTVAGRQIDRQEKSAVGTWESLGPDNVGGRTRRLLMDSNGTLFAAGVSGGVWRKAASETKWTPLADELANLNVGALVIDPNDDDILYAGTGEVYRHTNRPYSSMSGGGLFKSIDAGDTWVQLHDTVGEDFMYISDVVVSPNNSQRVYLASNTGIWRSDNGGASFESILRPVDGDDQPLFEGCTDLSIHMGAETDEVLASCASRSTDDRYFLPGLLPDACGGSPCDARVYFNADAGGDGQWSVALTESGMGRTSMARHYDDPNIVYAVSSSIVPGPDFNADGFGDYENGLHAVFRSDDGGRSWAATVRNSDPDKLNTFLLAYADMAFCSLISPYSAGWYNQAIEVDPHDPDVVWVGGMQLYRSDDGGQSFGLASYWYTDSSVSGSAGTYMHADIHTLYAPPGSGDLWIGNDGGVWYSDDPHRPTHTNNTDVCQPKAGGPTYAELNDGYTTTQFYHGVPYDDGEIYVGGLQDNGTVWTGSGSKDWSHILGGDGAVSAVSQDGQDLFVAYQNAGLGHYGANGFRWITFGLRGNDDFLFITPYILDSFDNTHLYVAGTHMWRSPNKGTTWEQASAQLLPGNDFASKATAITQAPTMQTRLLIGNGHGIYRHNQATFGSPAYIMTETDAPREGWVSSLIFDPNDAEIAYATYSTFGGQHVFKSTDGGLTWASIDGSGKNALPDIPVHTLAVHPDDPNRLYVGTDLGVFLTFDGGQNWAWEYSGFGTSIVESLQINTASGPSDERYLFAFTYGRGAWRASLDAVDATPPYSAGSDINGAWWDQPGQGVQMQLVEIDGEDIVHFGWYTHYLGQWMWVFGQAPLVGDQVRIEAYTAVGSNFPPNLNPDDVVVELWGTVDIKFVNGTEAIMAWQAAGPGFGAGTVHLSKQIAYDDISVPNTPVSMCKSGAWGNKDYAVGDGMFLQTILINGQPGLVISWYAFKDGLQYWIAGAGVFDGDTVIVYPAQVQGGQFPPAYSASDVTNTAWGEVKIKFLANGNARVTSTPYLEGFEGAFFTIKQLAPPKGC